MPTHDLAKLMVLIDEGYVFDSQTYPELNDANEYKFGINHSIFHMMKSMGVLVAELEKYDHGVQMEEEILRLATMKQLVNALKLTNHLGMTAVEISEYIDRQYNNQ